MRYVALQLVIVLFLAVIVSPAQGGVDDLETIGPDLTPVTQRIIDGVTVTISTTAGVDLLARTYGVLPSAFGGAGGADNEPLNPGNVSGSRFISSSGFAGGFDSVQPIIFEFSAPLVSFGLTTIDLLEDGAPSSDFVVLRAFDTTNTLVAEVLRAGPWGASGLDLDWLVVFHSGITKVHLSGLVTANPGFGIDDIVLMPLQTIPVESTTWGAVKSLYR